MTCPGSAPERPSTVFPCRDELVDGFHAGLLTRFELAWSRDHADKVYVQHCMLKHAGPLWDWLEAGASVCVCGDASRMAKGVDDALHQIIQRAGQRSPAQAADCVRQLVATRRYSRDVS